MADARVFTLKDKMALEAELKQLNWQKKRVIEDIIAARELGDLSENAEYLEAKEEEARLLQLIAQVETFLNTCVFVDDTGVSGD